MKQRPALDLRVGLQRLLQMQGLGPLAGGMPGQPGLDLAALQKRTPQDHARALAQFIQMICNRAGVPIAEVVRHLGQPPPAAPGQPAAAPSAQAPSGEVLPPLDPQGMVQAALTFREEICRRASAFPPQVAVASLTWAAVQVAGAMGFGEEQIITAIRSMFHPPQQAAASR